MCSEVGKSETPTFVADGPSNEWVFYRFTPRSVSLVKREITLLSGLFMQAVEQPAAHGLEWGWGAKPVFERGGSLVQQHGEAVGYPRPGCAGGGQHGGFWRAVDHVVDVMM